MSAEGSSAITFPEDGPLPSPHHLVDAKILGIAGGIGSGKSTACKILLEEIGCLAHIDADKVAHSVYEPGNPARSEIVQAFGPSVVNPNDDSINRPALGAIVFSDPAKMKQLECIVWPHTQKLVEAQVQRVLRHPPPDASTKRPIVIVEAAMLLEADWNGWMDGVWFVCANPEIALPRIVSRGGCTPEQAEQRLQAQQNRRGVRNLSDEVENGIVSAVITNDGSIEDLARLLAAKIDDPSAWYSSKI